MKHEQLGYCGYKGGSKRLDYFVTRITKTYERHKLGQCRHHISRKYGTPESNVNSSNIVTTLGRYLHNTFIAIENT